ncbi:DUF1396 domain-containing protein [Streptomyces sp. NBC_01622]|uniref:DUF1396 domain-containing protein n=1 Tax=Streptomyces sp. NBC_01622 TaxID=2975903 RepID=UPI003865FE03|nr:DUF1396 domain-containing protein [Streptomyces sp. NBC_01622]
MRSSVRRATRRRATGAGLAALLLAGGAVGCSKLAADSSPDMAPAAAVAEAAKKTQDITSLRYRMAGTMPGEGKITAEAAMSMKPQAMSMRMTSAKTGSTVQVRVVDKALYLNGGAETARELGGKHWLKLDMSALGGLGNNLTANGTGAAEADKNPAAEAAFLTGARDVKKVGTETVDGVRTTHYAGKVTLADVEAAAAKGENRDARERRAKSVESYQKMGVDALTMDMWVDGDHHTKRFRMRGEGDKGPLDMTVTFLDVNAPVTVTVPPAKDSTDLAQLMKDAQG